MNEQTEMPNFDFESPYLELFAPVVTVNVKHEFSNDERLQKSTQIAQLITDIEHEESEKKAVGSEYKNKIDKLKAEAKLISGHITNGFAFIDKTAELYLNYDECNRVYIDKHERTVLKTEPFHPSDYQKKLKLEGTQEQIDENNELGDYAEGESGSQGFKPTPKYNLGEHYGKSLAPMEDDEFAEFVNTTIEAPEEWASTNDGLTIDHNGNLTDIHPRDLANELKDHPETVDINAKVKAQVEEFKKTKANSKR